jgi:hypothetical protein
MSLSGPVVAQTCESAGEPPSATTSRISSRRWGPNSSSDASTRSRRRSSVSTSEAYFSLSPSAGRERCRSRRFLRAQGEKFSEGGLPVDAVQPRSGRPDDLDGVLAAQPVRIELPTARVVLDDQHPPTSHVPPRRLPDVKSLWQRISYVMRSDPDTVFPRLCVSGDMHRTGDLTGL